MRWGARFARAAVGAALAGVVAGCSVPGPVEVIAGPPDMVLDAYLHALVAGDCDVARRLATPDFRRGNGELCGDVPVTSYRIDPATAGDSATEKEFFVNLTSPTGSKDGSIEAGVFGWFFDLQRQPDGGWQLAGGGTGP